MTRPRGFAPWRPQSRAVEIIDLIQAILIEYAIHLPLTLRQIFYRLVGTDAIEKTEKAYGNLCELMTRARRAEIIPMDAIRDDGFTGGTGARLGYIDADEFVDELLDSAQTYQKDRQAGQTRRLVLWAEASGMVPQLARVADEYSVTVKSSGGFDSVTAKHAIAAELGGDRPATVLHIGDYDPSGECMFDALAEDVQAFGERYGHAIEFVRLAVTPAHIARYGLPTAPPKDSSHQARKHMVETTQAEALDPATLADIVRAGIEARLNLEIYQEVLGDEHHERADLIRRVGALRGLSDE